MILERNIAFHMWEREFGQDLVLELGHLDS